MAKRAAAGLGLKAGKIATIDKLFGYSPAAEWNSKDPSPIALQHTLEPTGILLVPRARPTLLTPKEECRRRNRPLELIGALS